MKQLNRRNVLEILGNDKRRYHTCLMTAYTFDFLYFERRILPVLRGTGINRFNHLLFDPQKQCMFPGEYLTSTRIVFKDNHRPCVTKPKVNDMNPYEKQEKCSKINGNVCGNFTKPLYQYDVCG